MRFMKRGLAAFLAVLLIIPTMPVHAEDPVPSAVSIALTDSTVLEEPAASAEPVASVEPTSLAEPTASQEPTVSAEPTASVEPVSSAEPIASAEPTPSAEPTVVQEVAPSETPVVITDEVLFNMGNHVWSIVNEEAFEEEMGDDCFDGEGNYTIFISETDPFFPYEVQFTYDGVVSSQWFMTPDDTVEIGGHTFSVHADFSGDVVTQMSLNVAGDTVIVYPEEKEFTNDENGGMTTYSLLPLEEKYFSVDLSRYTPAELTMVSVAEIFAGQTALSASDKVIWKYQYDYDDDYTISSSGDKLDLSYQTYSGSSNSWQMIVGNADQLDADNIRYSINVKHTNSEKWLTPTVYAQDSTGNRAKASVLDSSYKDYNSEVRRLEFTVSSDELGEEKQAFLSLSVNPAVFGSTVYDHFKVYEGKYTNAAEAVLGTDITAQICNADMIQANAGFAVERYSDQWITMVTFDASGNVTGCLPVRLYLESGGNYISYSHLFGRTDAGSTDYATDFSSSYYSDGCRNITMTLYQGYAANAAYYEKMTYYKNGIDSSSSVTAAYAGNYSSIVEATSAGAADIKNALFGTGSDSGYGADYSQGVDFTIFVGADGAADQEVYHYNIKTLEGTNPKNTLNSGTSVRFSGLKDSSGTDIASYVAAYDEDSYAEKNYLTILVDSNVDLTNLAPVFTTDDGIHLYASGSSSPEISGQNYHDFSKGAVQYTASAEDGKNAKNYWLQVVKATAGTWKIYINSFGDSNANTREESGVIYSNREVMLDGYHEDRHDILVANMGTNEIPNLKVELASDVVVLDDYWTLSGNYSLSGFTTTEKEKSYGELPNLAKIRLKVKDGVAGGTDVSGTLTIKSGNTTLAVLTLTGTVGDPCITTRDIPQAVKYVPYGTMIQNNNKYSWNKVSYGLISGSLPAGMVVKPNGEIYGVPTETGEFTFTVQMKNSYSAFSSSEMTYTLTVIENTDANVDAATDSGYDLTQRVQGVSASDTAGSQTMVSQGVYAEFVDIYLDGIKLVEGTDYTSESGSTRITIYTQTLTQGGSASNGTHTLGVEFRTQDDDILKRAAQNYTVTNHNSGTNNDGEDSGSSSGSGSSSDRDHKGSENSTNNNSVNNTAAGSSNAAGTLGRNNAAGTDMAETVSYTVAAGDTLWKIAEKFYGSGAYWQKIFADNADVIKNPDKIYSGQTLKIYPLQGTGITVDEDGNVIVTDGVEENDYTVQPGDTLWKIAQKVYGKGWKWRKIYKANSDVISEPGQIYTGQVLVIPEA